MKTKFNKSQAMEKLLAEQPDILVVPKIGDMVAGKVISVNKSVVHLDIDGLSTGVVRGRELYDESGEYSNLTVGDDVEATVVDLENENGEMELSFQKAGHQKAWQKLEKLHADGEIIKVRILSANKGGLMARFGKITGFLPVSQLTIEHYPRVEGGDKNKILERLTRLINKELDVKILDLDEAEEKLIFSEKTAWEELQKNTISQYQVGDVVEGRVSGVVDFGAFVEFGEGLEGLVHISELAWQRIDNPADVIKVGDTVKAQIINVEGSKISLSIKKLLRDPWKDAAEKYKVGDIVEGKVLKVNAFGLFVELDQDIHGLAHISELSDKGNKKPDEIAKSGDTLNFKILSIEPDDHRLGLSLKTDTKKETPADKADDKAKKDDAKKDDAKEADKKEASTENKEENKDA